MFTYETPSAEVRERKHRAVYTFLQDEMMIATQRQLI